LLHNGPYLADRYFERKESAEELAKRVNQRAAELHVAPGRVLF